MKINSELVGNSINDKIDIIEEICSLKSITGKEISILDWLSRDQESEVRARVAEALIILLPDVSSEEILVRLLKDDSEIVRVNACDSLSLSNSLEVMLLLQERVMKDKSSMVRGYAALSLSDIAININSNHHEQINFLQQALGRERVDWVKINIYKALYTLGNEPSLYQLLNGLNSRLYKNRSVTISCLKDLVSPKNCSIIKLALTKQLQLEKSVAVKNKIEKFFEDLKIC